MIKKVFLGLNNTAGVCTRLKTGFKQNNIKSDFYSYKKHSFGYETDLMIRYSSFRIIRIFQKFYLISKLVIKYKYFIFDSASTLLPNYLDVKIFRFFGKKCMMIFTGCDIRIPDLVKHYKWNPCFECDDNYKSFVGCVIPSKKQMIKKVEKEFDIIVAPQEASGFLTAEFSKAYFPVNLEKFPEEHFKDRKLNKKLKILHAPSNPVYKGTKYIVAAIDKLKTQFDFEFKMVTNISIQELYKEIQESDLIIDQMLTGIYGLFSIEAMAMYKPVVCYVREDSWKFIENDCPIFNTNPDLLYQTLFDILNNPEQLVDVGNRSRNFVEKYHDAKIISKQYYELLEEK